MKAVIMAGGQGTRLRPLTCDLPKPMVSVLNYPVMEHIIKLLKRQGITDIVVTTFYLPRMIEEYFGNGEKWGVNLYYYIEETPLGTAGSVRNAADFLDETFVVISGDAITDFNLQQGINFHREKDSDGTLILSKEEIPLEYGVVMTDDSGQIIRFLEKPNWGQVFSDTVNTGIYILEPDIFELFEKGIKFDFSKELFPLMMKKGKNLNGIALDGYWNDIGNLEEYHKTHFDFLKNKVNLPLDNCKQLSESIFVEEDVEIADSAELVGPLYIGSGTRIGDSVYLEKSVIGKNNVIKPYASLKQTISWNNNYLGSHCELRGCVLANNVTLKERVNVFDRTAVGKKVTVGREAIIRPSVKIWPEKEVESGADVEHSIIWSPKWSRQLFSNIGVVGVSNVDITPEFVSRLATAYGSTLEKNQEITVSSDSYRISNCLKRAFISGLQTAGINLVDLGEVTTPIARYSIVNLEAGGGVHIRVSYDNPEKEVIEILNKHGGNIAAGEQRAIAKKFFAEDYNRVLPDEIGQYSYAPEMSQGYLQGVLDSIDQQMIRRNYFSLVVDFEHENLLNILPVFLRKLNCQIISTRNFSDDGLPLSINKRLQVKEKVGRIIRDNGSDLGLIIDHNAEQINLVNREGEVLTRAQYQVLISYLLLEKGLKELFLPLNTPTVIEDIADEYGAHIHYTPIRPQFSMNEYFRNIEDSDITSFYPYADGIYGLGLVLEKMARDNITLAQLINILPEFHLNKAEIPCNWQDKGRVMRHLTEVVDESTDLIDGIKFNHDNGWALVIPDSEQPVFHIFAEGQDEESAESLTGFYLEQVKKIIDKEES